MYHVQVYVQVKYMICPCNDCLSIDNGITMKLSEDGSGRGAAMVAAVAHRLKKQ